MRDPETSAGDGGGAQAFESGRLGLRFHFSDRVTLNKTFSFSEPQFPHLSNEGREVEWERNEVIQAKGPAHSEYSGAVHVTHPEKLGPG